MDASEVADAIGVQLVGKLAHGAGAGAHEVRVDGRRAVLKFDDGNVLDFAFAAEVVVALHARGYPAPATIATGRIGAIQYDVSELVPGEPIGQPAAAHVAPLVALIDVQRDVGLTGRRPWVEDVVTSLTEGRHGYCELETLRRANPGLLNRLQRIADERASVEPATTDVVHFDFSPFNVLGDVDRITGVVDWQGATSGDAAFDLVTMAYYTHEIALRDSLLDAARARTDPRALPLYAAHMVLRQVDWSLRHDDATTVRWFTDLGAALLDVLEAESGSV